MLQGYMPLTEINLVILWVAVAVSGQHLQLQIWMSWFWSFMKLKPSSSTRFASLTNIRLKIIAYHQKMSSIYNWELCWQQTFVTPMIRTSQFWSHSFFVNNAFDHATDHHASDPVLALSLPTSFMQCTLYDRKWNFRQGQDWTRLVTPHDSLFHMLFKNRMQISCVLKLHCMQFNKAKQQIHCNGFSKLCCSFISAYNFPFTKFTFA